MIYTGKDNPKECKYFLKLIKIRNKIIGDILCDAPENYINYNEIFKKIKLNYKNFENLVFYITGYTNSKKDVVYALVFSEDEEFVANTLGTFIIEVNLIYKQDINSFIEFQKELITNELLKQQKDCIKRQADTRDYISKMSKELESQQKTENKITACIEKIKKWRNIEC